MFKLLFANLYIVCVAGGDAGTIAPMVINKFIFNKNVQTNI